jgi:O-antigen ligase
VFCKKNCLEILKQLKDQYPAIALFTFAAFAPLQDLIRIPANNYQIRLGYLLSVLLFIYVVPKMRRFLTDWRMLFLIGLAIYLLAMQMFSNTGSPRGLLFCGWFIVHIVIVISSACYANALKYLYRGLLFGQIINFMVAVYVFFFAQGTQMFQDLLASSMDNIHLRSYGLLGEPSYVALCQGPLLLLLLGKKKNTQFERAAIYLLMLSLVFSFSRSAYLAIVIIIPFTIIYYFKTDRIKDIKLKLLLPLFLGLFTAFLYYPNFFINTHRSPAPSEVDNSIRKVDIPERSLPDVAYSASPKERLVLLKMSFDLFKQKPLLGHGLSNIPHALKENNPDWRSTGKTQILGCHNLFLEILVENGLIGLTFFLGFLVSLFYVLIREKLYVLTATASLLMISMQFSQNINMPAMWIYFSIAFAAINSKKLGLSNFPD